MPGSFNFALGSSKRLSWWNNTGFVTGSGSGNGKNTGVWYRIFGPKVMGLPSLSMGREEPFLVNRERSWRVEACLSGVGSGEPVNKTWKRFAFVMDTSRGALWPSPSFFFTTAPWPLFPNFNVLRRPIPSKLGGGLARFLGSSRRFHDLESLLMDGVSKFEEGSSAMTRMSMLQRILFRNGPCSCECNPFPNELLGFAMQTYTFPVFLSLSKELNLFLSLKYYFKCIDTNNIGDYTLVTH